MWRCEVAEAGQGALPAIDLAGPIVIGSGPGAQVRLPASVAREAHVEISGTSWFARADVVVGDHPVSAGARGTLDAPVTFVLGTYRVRVAAAPMGTLPSSPQRTESLARELVRSMLGGDSAPSLTIERGPGAGARRSLPPPEAAVVVGRGDEAGWVIADPDLSRTHVELRRGWDGVTLVDLGSKNGTTVDGVRVRAPLSPMLRDGALIELGKVALRFHDPAERHLRGAAPMTAAAVVAPARPNRSVLVVALVIAALAIAALGWVLAS